MSYLFAFLASLVYIWAKAAQQLHVMHFEYRRIVPTSMVMATCEVFIMVNIIRSAESFGGLVMLALALGSGAGLGCIAAMWLHQKRRGS